MSACRVTGACVVVFGAAAGRALLESSGLVDGHAGGAILVLAVGVDELGGEGVFAAIARAGRRWGRREIVSVKINVRSYLAEGACLAWRAWR